MNRAPACMNSVLRTGDAHSAWYIIASSGTRPAFAMASVADAESGESPGGSDFILGLLRDLLTDARIIAGDSTDAIEALTATQIVRSCYPSSMCVTQGLRRYALARSSSQPSVGHNALGGWSVVLVLALLLVEAATGLYANDETDRAGPLFGWGSAS